MRRSYGGLPRVRLSAPGGSTKSTPRPGPWAALLLLCGVLLLTCYSRLAGHVRLSVLDKRSNTSKGGSSQHGRNVQTAASSIAATGANVQHMQRMQPGMEIAGSSLLASNGVSFLQAQHSIKDPADAMARRPAVHGRVQKAGMTDPVAWANNHTDARRNSFLSWRLARSREGGPGPADESSYTCPAADHPPLPFPGCHVFVNHQ